MRERIQYINKSSLDNTQLENRQSYDFGKIKIGRQIINNAVVDYRDYGLRKINPKFTDKEEVFRAIANNDQIALREISSFYYKTSGIYARLCKYMAYLYRYDWMVTPYLNSKSANPEKIKEEFNKVLAYLDKFEIKRFFGEVALKVIKNGCYYGYLVPNGDCVQVQELSPNYCRSYLKSGMRPVVEFNMRYFDDMYRDPVYKQRILNLYPAEFKKGYKLYKEGKLGPNLEWGDTYGWYVLDPNSVIKFNLSGEDYPPFISVIPAIIDLIEAKGLDKKKMEQELVKIIIQKLPIDKNGDLIFDPDEGQALHNNAKQMIGSSPGLNVLTTYADIGVEEVASTAHTNATDNSMKRVLQAIFDEAGTSQMQFNTDGNVALEKSILNDEAVMYNLLQQFEAFLNYLIKPFNTNKKVSYRVQLLTTTIYNYKDLSKLYKEQTQLGYSKFLPPIALGEAQSVVLANAYFENEVLKLNDVFTPPMMSSTMSAKNGSTNSNNGKTNNQPQAGEDSKAGRKELPDDQKSEKTLKNLESQS